MKVFFFRKNCNSQEKRPLFPDLGTPNSRGSENRQYKKDSILFSQLQFMNLEVTEQSSARPFKFFKYHAVFFPFQMFHLESRNLLRKPTKSLILLKISMQRSPRTNKKRINS